MTPRKETLADGIELWLGDCREVVEALGDKFADLVFTDPPYGHNNNNGDLIARRESALGQKAVAETEWRPIANDGAQEATELAQWLFDNSPSWLRAGGCCCCCCGGGGPDPQFARWSLMMNGPLDFKQMIVWDKGPIGMGWHYRRSYETVLVGQKPGGACKWYDSTQQIENIIRPGSYGIKKILPSKDQHPTEKPWELAAHFIRLHTEPNDTVFDPFMGQGSTGYAAVRLGRAFIGVELEEKFFNAACKKVSSATKQPDFFIERPKPAKQEVML